MQRPVFADGHLLRTSDFVAEQNYHLAAIRRHNGTLHIWGIASGLQIALLDGDLVVKPGTAIDGFGRYVVLDAAGGIDLRSFRIRGIDAVDVWAAYTQDRAEAAGDGVDSVTDAARIECTEAKDIDPRRPSGVSAADLVTGATRQDADPDRRWPVYLGRVTIDLARPHAAPVIDMDRRATIGLVGATVETPEGFVWLELTEGPDPTVQVNLPDGPDGTRTPLKVSAADGVELDAPLTVDRELVLRGGSLTVLPGAPALGPAADAAPPEWSVSHAVDDVTHDLRVAMPAAADETVPNRLVVGAWRNNRFAPSLVIDGAGTLIVFGNLVIEGRLQAASVQEAPLSEEARAYLAGVQTAGLLSLFNSIA
ncbi:hypothetical protein G6045_09810 [Streptomyces sp. YC504]|uniref:Uncharacterized protein n=1 Tax=Streptomyces mesophilus TaxID=1775132 RepID=A0A6G4XEH9_9ACTN|nr:hypothetical protein [Streptomyces mesophilus]NGO75966.1 hypothetical protein [Streptomyces mesophilus]